MSHVWFWSILAGLQSICLFVGFQASKKHRSQSDYYLAGKSLTFFPLLMTFVATQVGGGLILGSAEEAYRYGWKIIFYPMGAISGFFLLSSSLGRRLAGLPVSTVAQIFEVVYGSKSLKKVASILSMITLLMITVAQVLASQKFLACFQLGNSIWFFLFWIIVFLYTMWGGMEGIASIDVIQASYFLIALGISALFLVIKSDISWNSLWLQSNLTPNGEFPLVGWFLMPCLFMLIEQDMAQRCFSARSPGIIKRAALGSAILIFVVSLIPILFGLIGRNKGITVPQGSSVLLSIIQATTSPFISATVACAIMMAIISTAVSLIHSISSNLTQDFEFSWSKGPFQVWFIKGLTLGIGLLALGISYFFNNIVDVLIQSYELSVVCLFFPVLMSLFQKRGNPTSATLAITFGAGAFLFCRIIPIPFPREIFEIMTSIVGYGLGSILVQRLEYRQVGN
jgi:SSS family solute:Na+ symporter